MIQKLSPLTMPPRRELAGFPVAVIGAGPVDLAAAAHPVERGIEVVVLESGDTAGAAVRAWNHTRLFSPREFLIDPAAGRLLDSTEWALPDMKRMPFDSRARRGLPDAAHRDTGTFPHIRSGATVTNITQQGMDRKPSANRSSTPFLLGVVTDGDSNEVLARAVIDTAGGYSTPNGLTASGLTPVHGDQVTANVTHALPDILGADRAQFAGHHTLVVGARYSAANTLLKLASLARDEPEMTISWAIREASPVRGYGFSADEFEGRGQLGTSTHDLVREGIVALIDRFEIDDQARAENGRVTIHGRRNGTVTAIDADTVVNDAGFRPNIDMIREIRTSLDDIVEAPVALAPLIGPNLHSCGSVPPHGVVELSHAASNFYVAGMKSYEHAPTSLLATGYEQVRFIADERAGNSAAARIVQLVLPATGVCSTGSSAATDPR